MRLQDDSITAGETCSERLGLSLREHEREAVPALVRREVAPADEITVVARPRRCLIRKIRQDAGGAVLDDRQSMHRVERSTCEHDLAGDCLARIVVGARPVTDIDEICRHIGILAVVCQRDRQLWKASDRLVPRLHLFEPGLLRSPP
jgi:hypothetical protein